MSAVYEMEPYRFEHDPKLAAEILKAVALQNSMVIQDLIDGLRLLGIDPRSSASEIGRLLADGKIKPIDSTDRLDKWTVVELAT